MEKPKVAGSRKVQKRSRKSVAPALEPEPTDTPLRSMMIAQWEKRPRLDKHSPSAKELEEYRQAYRVWEAEMDATLKR